MSFFIYDLIFLIIFSSFLVIFLYKRRKKLKREGILILYRTKIGIKAINFISKKYKRYLNSFEIVLLFTGYLLMAGMVYLLFQLIYIFVSRPGFIRDVKIPPIMPLVPYIPRIFKIDFLPPFYFTYWIIVLAIAAISHEFFHGIFAKARNVKIKSTGFAFLGPFTGAFVDPDEKQVKKLKIREQLGFLCAGTFANVIMAILFFLIMWLFFVSAFVPSGVIFDDYTFSVFPISNITMMNGITLENPSYKEVVKLINGTDVVKIDGKIYDRGIAGFSRDKNGTYYIRVYQDTPAIRAGLAGVIIEFDGEGIKTSEELKEKLSLKKPGDVVEIKTLSNDSVRSYKIKLTGRPDNKTKAYLGIAQRDFGGISIMSKIRKAVLFFKEPNTAYKPKLFSGIMIFIYNLIWWVVLVNFSVALVNMLPLGIFDGGRVFYLTIFWITKSKKFAEKAYRFSTFFFLLVFLLLMILWFVNFPL